MHERIDDGHFFVIFITSIYIESSCLPRIHIVFVALYSRICRIHTIILDFSETGPRRYIVHVKLIEAIGHLSSQITLSSFHSDGVKNEEDARCHEEINERPYNLFLETIYSINSVFFLASKNKFPD